ncbi:MAG: hypothetical protein EPN82_02450 [Bacteroidetes bacterium]|nr:MAG: hypothetical protein EPN82_02450 [Bacteroidota bacterium]
MARIRTIKPEHWKDEDIAKVSMQANLLYIALWNFADDSGCIRDDSDYLKSEIFAWRKDVKSHHVQTWLQELKEKNFIIPFQFKNSDYLLIRTFNEHQRIDKPQVSKIPQDVINQVIKQYEDKFKLLLNHSENHQGIIQEPSTNNPLPLQEPVTTYSSVLVCKGNESKCIIEEGKKEIIPPEIKFIPQMEEIIDYFSDKHELSRDQATLIAEKYIAVRKKFQLHFKSKYFCNKNGIEVKSLEELELDLNVWLANEKKEYDKNIINNKNERMTTDENRKYLEKGS